MDSWGEDQCCEGGEHLAATVQIVSEGSSATACNDVVCRSSMLLAKDLSTCQHYQQAYIEGEGHIYLTNHLNSDELQFSLNL